MTTQTDSSGKQPGPGKPQEGFTPERDRKLIMFSCLMLILMSLAIFLMVRTRLGQLSDVTGAYAQVGLTAAADVREQATEYAASELVDNSGAHVAQWLASSGTVAFVHDKKGDPINWEKPSAAMGSVYWLDCGLPVTAVKPVAPVARVGEQIRFWGQIAETDVSKLEFSDANREEILQRFGLQPGQRIAIFFASEVELQDSNSSLSGESAELSQPGGDSSAQEDPAQGSVEGEQP